MRNSKIGNIYNNIIKFVESSQGIGGMERGYAVYFSLFPNL